MSYINFGMRKSLFAVRGRDTFPCTVCERIPGIIPNEFIYLAGFDQLDPASGIFRLCISDTLLGFGELSMEIKNEIPQTPD
ncbi:MAG: hypothetical protein ABI813_15415 [Bacteroidota bacterium]